MDFPRNDYMTYEYDMDESSSPSDAQHDHEKIPTIKQSLRNVSGSIPIQSGSKILPVSGDKQTSKSEPRILGTQGISSSSVSPSSSLIPRIIRESFSKLLQRSSGQRGKTPDKDSDSECSENERKTSSCSSISPATEEVVIESLKKGLPIIPFAYPTFFTVGRCQENIMTRMRKNSLKSMKRSFSEGRCFDYPDIGEEDEDILRKVNSEDKSLDSIVRIAQQQMVNNLQGEDCNVEPVNESQSAYVEMSPEDMIGTKCDPYMRMEENYIHMEKRKQSDDRMFYLETSEDFLEKNSSMGTPDYLVKKPSKRKHSLFYVGKCKSELQMPERMGRYFRKGNKHKDDYVFFDFERNRDYMDMGNARTKKWHFLDFRNNK